MSMVVEITLARSSCPICGIVFAMPEFMHAKRMNDGGEFFCPNGHALAFTTPAVVTLRRELEAVKRSLADTKMALAENRLATMKAKAAADQVAEKKRRRVNAGVCPHCQRSFRALARHIKTKHPTEPLPNT